MTDMHSFLEGNILQYIDHARAPESRTLHHTNIFMMLFVHDVRRTAW
jgi:hypothetical protein